MSRFPGIQLAQELLGKVGSCYVIGSTDAIINKAVKNIRDQYKNLNQIDYHHGYFNKQEELTLIKDIQAKKPDLVLIGCGSPKQYEFLEALSRTLTTGIGIGVGGAFDVISGHKKRAPKWSQAIHLEWLYRMIQEPNRISRLPKLMTFIKQCIKSRGKEIDAAA